MYSTFELLRLDKWHLINVKLLLLPLQWIFIINVHPLRAMSSSNGETTPASMHPTFRICSSLSPEPCPQDLRSQETQELLSWSEHIHLRRILHIYIHQCWCLFHFNFSQCQTLPSPVRPMRWFMRYKPIKKSYLYWVRWGIPFYYE